MAAADGGLPRRIVKVRPTPLPPALPNRRRPVPFAPFRSIPIWDRSADHAEPRCPAAPPRVTATRHRRRPSYPSPWHLTHHTLTPTPAMRPLLGSVEPTAPSRQPNPQETQRLMAEPGESSTAPTARTRTRRRRVARCARAFVCATPHLHAAGRTGRLPHRSPPTVEAASLLHCAAHSCVAASKSTAPSRPPHRLTCRTDPHRTNPQFRASPRRRTRTT